MPVCSRPIQQPPLPKPPDSLIDWITLVHQLPKIKDEPIDVTAIELKLNMKFEKNVPQQEEIIHKGYERPGKEYM